MDAAAAGELRGPPGAVLRGDVVDVRRFGSMVRLRLSVAGWRPAFPGQFAMLRASGSRCFLPRAFSVHSQGYPAGDHAPARVSFLVSPVGAATEELVALFPGDEVAVVGPVGRGFEEPPLHGPGRLVVVGGGAGVAPFLFLLEHLGSAVAAGIPGSRPDSRPPGAAREILLLFGFRDEPQAGVLDLFDTAADDLRAVGASVHTEAICEDGSLGRAGLVTNLLEEELRPGDTVLACGAHAMCAAVWDLCRRVEGVGAWFSLEAGMACGVGSCQGCVIPTADGGLAKVCRRGPVFGGEEMFEEGGHPCARPEEGAP